MENEFDIVNKRMEKNLEMRHTYLMFAFTTAIAAIAAFFIIGFSNITAWFCIVPFAVIIPFQARISYSRLSHAKMEAYVMVFYPGKFKFIEIELNELRGVPGKIIAIIANYELTLLSVVLDILFIIIKKEIMNGNILLGLDFLIMIISTAIVFGLATYTFSYGKFWKKYINIYKSLSLKIEKESNMDLK